jgi:hypothetical protein
MLKKEGKLVPFQVMKAHMGMEIWLHSLTSALDGDEW